MSGQTIGDMLQAYSPAGVCLFAPGAYGAAAQILTFNKGFTEFIRTERSWADSLTFDAYSNFTGPKMLVTPAHDGVIPIALTEKYAEAIINSAFGSRIIIPEAPHQLAAWLTNNHTWRKQVIKNYLQMVAAHRQKADKPQ